MSETTLPTKIEKRKRVPQACKPCKQRKRKCNGDLPCAECHRTGHLCDYAEDLQAGQRIRRRSINTTSPRHGISDSNGTLPAPVMDGYAAAGTSFNAGILDRKRSRYVGGDSSIALTSTLVHHLTDAEFRVHASGWHLGLRRETQVQSNVGSTPLLQLFPDFRQLESLLFVYSTVINSFYCLVNQDQLLSDVQQAYKLNQMDEELEIVVASAAALGSFFSDTLEGRPSSLEEPLIERVNAILFSPAARRLPRKGHARTLGLLTLYYRASTRPHLAWYTSCQSLLLCEATGLHQKIPDTAEAASDRRTFFMLQGINRMLAMEYGRSAIALRNITMDTYSIDRHETDASNRQVQQFCHATDILLEEDISLSYDLFEQAAKASTNAHLVYPLHLADACFCIYRRHRLHGRHLSANQKRQVVDIGRKAVSAANRLIALHQPWWYLTNTTLQFVCVLVAMNDLEYLQDLDNCLQCLQSVQQAFDTSMTREAFNTARNIIDKDLARREQALKSALVLVENAKRNTRSNYYELPAIPTFSDSPIDSVINAFEGENSIDVWQNLLGFNFDAHYT